MSEKNDMEKIREARNTYQREYRKKHAATIKKNQDAYWLRKANEAEKTETEQK